MLKVFYHFICALQLFEINKK